MLELERAIGELREALPELEIYENEPMQRHCSFKIGGAVRAFACPEDLESLEKICSVLRGRGIAPFILGNGSNILFPDEGLKDLFIISTEKLQKLNVEDEKIYAQAGVSLARLAGAAQQQGLSGLEFASGIPGTVGGGLTMNAGAYGGELKDCVESVDILYLPERKLYRISGQDCRFGYRHSIFQEISGCVILSACFRLEPGDREQIAAAMRDFNQRRRDKQPLDLPSGGSTFRRPEGYFAAALIQEAGLKGLTVGGAQVSEKHAGFIVNAGGASSHDVAALIEQVKEKVYAASGVSLETELISIPADYALRAEPAPEQLPFEGAEL